MDSHTERPTHTSSYGVNPVNDHSMGTGMGMSMVFNSSTEVTLLFRGWSTTTTTSYIFALVFVFALAVSSRFLGVLKLQLDIKHTASTSPSPRCALPKPQLSAVRQHRHAIFEDRMNPLPLPESFPSAPLLEPDPDRTQDGVSRSSIEEPHNFLKRRGLWSVCRRRDWRQDATSALLEGLRSLVSYAL